MSKDTLRNPLEQEGKTPSPINGVVEEIKGQDLDEKVVGAGMSSAIQLSLAGKCGSVFTVSYECTSNNVSCGK